MIIGGVAALVVAGGVVAGVLAMSASGSGTTARNGNLTLTGGDGYTTYDPCHGTNNGLADFSDMSSTTQSSCSTHREP